MEDLDGLVTKVWLKGDANILGDAPSRNPKDRDKIKHLAVPGSPIKRCIQTMFAPPITDAVELAEMARIFNDIQDVNVDLAVTAGDRPENPIAQAD